MAIKVTTPSTHRQFSDSRGAKENVIPRFGMNVCGYGAIIEQVSIAHQASVSTLAEIKHVNSQALAQINTTCLFIL